MVVELVNPCLPLEPSHISNDLLNISRHHPFDFRHIAELPVVCTDAILRRALEGDIGVMIRFINLMYQWRTLLGPDTSHTVASGTIGAEFRLAHLNIRRRRSSGRLRGILIRSIGITGRQSRNHHRQPDSRHPHLHLNIPDYDSPHRGGSVGVVVA